MPREREQQKVCKGEKSSSTEATNRKLQELQRTKQERVIRGLKLMKKKEEWQRWRRRMRRKATEWKTRVIYPFAAVVLYPLVSLLCWFLTDRGQRVITWAIVPAALLQTHTYCIMRGHHYEAAIHLDFNDHCLNYKYKEKQIHIHKHHSDSWKGIRFDMKLNPHKTSQTQFWLFDPEIILLSFVFLNVFFAIFSRQARSTLLFKSLRFDFAKVTYPYLKFAFM